MTKLELKKLELHPKSRRSMLITWEFAPTLLPFAEYDIYIERSESPEEGYTRLTKVAPSFNSYTDEDFRIFRHWKDTYVRLHIVPKDGSAEYYTETTRIAYAPDVEALEFIRRLELTLGNKKYGVGMSCMAFLRKHGGQRCAECYDPLKKRVIKSHCSTCYTVGYEGGFYSPIPLHVAFSPDQKQVAITDRGPESVSKHNAYTIPYPILNSGDLIYDARMLRLWSVESISQVERRRHPVKQNLALEEVDKSSAFYQMCEDKLKDRYDTDGTLLSQE